MSDLQTALAEAARKILQAREEAKLRQAAFRAAKYWEKQNGGKDDVDPDKTDSIAEQVNKDAE